MTLATTPPPSIPRIRPQEYPHPDRWQTFSIRLYCGADPSQRAVDRLENDELAWVARVVLAELQKRASK